MTSLIGQTLYFILFGTILKSFGTLDRQFHVRVIQVKDFGGHAVHKSVDRLKTEQSTIRTTTKTSSTTLTTTTVTPSKLRITNTPTSTTTTTTTLTTTTPLPTTTLTTHATTTTTTSLTTPTTPPKDVFGLKVVKENVTWKGAEKACYRDYRRLVVIDSAEKQSEAVKVAMASGLDVLAIGLFMHNFQWVYLDERKMKYEAWAPGHPLGFHGAMARIYDYQWIGLITKADGYICQI